MHLLGLFDIAKSALFASQTALNITSRNIANVNTPGFSRQEAVFEASTPAAVRGGFLGSGVNVSGIRRNYDNFIQSQLLGQYQNYGRSSALDETFGRIEQILNEAQDIGISVPLTEYFNAWQDLSANPEGQTQRIVLLQKAAALVTAAERTETGITDTLTSMNDQMNSVTGSINSIATQIAALNERIVQAEGASSRGAANDLRDQRDNLMNELAKLTEFSTYEANDGSVSISVGMRNLVYGAETNTLSLSKDANGDNILSLDGINITSRIDRGRLGGLNAAMKSIESNQLAGLRRLVASLVKETNLLHRSGFGLDGLTGNNFFAPLELSIKDLSAGADCAATIADLSQVTLSEYDITFDASGNYHVLDQDRGIEVSSGVYVSGSPITFDGIGLTITGSVTSSDTFSVSATDGAVRNFGVSISDFRKIAAAGSAGSLPGDNTNALAIERLSGQSMTGLGGLTFMEFYKGLVADIGSLSSAASDTLKFDSNLLTDLQNQRESVSGVSLDEEAVNLIKFQRSFEAAARMIKVTDELLQTILSL